MATKTKTASKKKTPAAKPVSTPVRHSAIPKVSAKPIAGPSKKSFSREDVALKAYFISLNTNGSEVENWLAAEAELSGK